jgi:hypothetical protein
VASAPRLVASQCLPGDEELQVAERIVRQLIDDIDGSEIPEGGGARIEFSVRGVEYAIDLSAVNTAKFDKALKPYIAAAQQIRRASQPRKPKATSAPAAALTGEQSAAVRDWARNNGYEVSSRGRIRTEIIEAFEAAH